MSKHYCYKYVLNDEIIYVGITDNLERRFNQHGKVGDNIPENGWDEINKSEKFYIELANSTMAKIFESEMIHRYKPKYNSMERDSEWSGLPFVEPEWKPYVYISTTNIAKTKNSFNCMNPPYLQQKEVPLRDLFAGAVSTYIFLRVLSESKELYHHNDKIYINMSNFAHFNSPFTKIYSPDSNTYYFIHRSYFYRCIELGDNKFETRYYASIPYDSYIKYEHFFAASSKYYGKICMEILDIFKNNYPKSLKKDRTFHRESFYEYIEIFNETYNKEILFNKVDINEIIAHLNRIA